VTDTLAAAALFAAIAAWCLYRGLTYEPRKHGSTRVIGWETSGFGAVIGFFQEFLGPRPAYLIAGAVFAFAAVGLVVRAIVMSSAPA
jgi:hypothetical protein